MKLLEQDIYSICNSVNQRVSRADNYTLVNLAIANKNVFSYPSILEIPLSYGYHIENSIREMERIGIIEAKVENRWYVGIRDKWRGEIGEDNLNKFLREKQLINKDQIVDFYLKHDSNSRKSTTGPRAKGLFAVYLDLTKARKYIRLMNTSVPHFNSVSGELTFLGEKISVNGSKTRRDMNVLIENVNSVVLESEFLGEDDSQIDTTKRRFTRLKDCTDKNDVLKQVFVYTMSGGYGLFIDQKRLKQYLQTPKLI